MKARNLSYMKEYNRKTVLKLLFRSPMCRAELAQKTKLTPAAISIITEALIEEGYIRETEKQSRRLMLEINAERFVVFGVQLARDFVSICMTDFCCNILKHQKLPLEHYEAEEVLDWIAQTALYMLSSADIPMTKVKGIGINAPGPLNVDKGIIINPPNFEKWHHYPIIERLKERLPFPVYLEKNTLAIYKNLFGDFGHPNVLHISMGDGIGGTLVLNNEVVSGHGGMGGEIGHMSIDKRGAQCPCGNHGCLELYASEKAIVQRAQEQGCYVNSWRGIVDMAEQGQTLYKSILMQEADFLATAIVSVLNLLDLDEVLLCGFIDYRAESLLYYINSIVKKTMIARDDHTVTIKSLPVLENEVENSAAAMVLYHMLRT